MVIWLLIILFWLARIQGSTDARRDAVNGTSTLPVITLVFPEKQIAFGLNLDDTLSPSLKGYRIIGNESVFNYWRNLPTNDIEIEIVWRLLLENNKWTYIFPALSAQSKENERPPIFAINQDKEGQLMILTPDSTQSK